MLTPLPVDSFTSVYRPPLDCCAEFAVEVTNVPAETNNYSMVTGNYASILVITEGTNCEFKQGSDSIAVGTGSVVFIAANTPVTVTTTATPLEFYRAHVNLSSEN